VPAKKLRQLRTRAASNGFAVAVANYPALPGGAHGFNGRSVAFGRDGGGTMAPANASAGVRPRDP